MDCLRHMAKTALQTSPLMQVHWAFSLASCQWIFCCTLCFLDSPAPIAFFIPHYLDTCAHCHDNCLLPPVVLERAAGSYLSLLLQGLSLGGVKLSHGFKYHPQAGEFQICASIPDYFLNFRSAFPGACWTALLGLRCSRHLEP